MPRTLYSKQIKETMERPVFGVRDLVGLGVPSGYARLRLHLLLNSGRVKRIERGKYTTIDDALVVATHITEPCYLSLWSALSKRNLTTQIPFSVQVVTSRKRYERRIVFEGTEIVYYQVRPAMMFGYEYIIHDRDWRVPVARAEKIIIDAIYLKALPLDELDEAVEGADPDKLSEYSILTRNQRVIKTVKELLRC